MKIELLEGGEFPTCCALSLVIDVIRVMPVGKLTKLEEVHEWF